MANENSLAELTAEVHETRRILGYMLWSLGALLTIRQPIEIESTEGRKTALAALNGFAALIKLALDEAGKTSDGRTSLQAPPWVM